MSVVLAVKKNKKTVIIGSDGLVSSDNGYIYKRNLNKWLHKAPNIYVGCAGDYYFFNKLQITDMSHCRNVLDIKNQLLEMFEPVTVEETDVGIPYYGNLDLGIVILEAKSVKMYTIDAYGFSILETDPICVGARNIGMVALDILKIYSPENRVKNSLRYCCKHNVNCGGTLFTKEVTYV
jgi:hypothetical protein